MVEHTTEIAPAWARIDCLPVDYSFTPNPTSPVSFLIQSVYIHHLYTLSGRVKAAVPPEAFVSFFGVVNRQMPHILLLLDE